MKKSIILIVVFLTLCIILSIPMISNARTEYTYEKCEDGIKITRCSTNEKIVTVPSELDGLPVVEIATTAFNGISSINMVVLPNTIKRIGSNAFFYTTNLSKIVFPENQIESTSGIFLVTKIDNVTIPDGWTEIPNYIFSHARILTNITIPNGVKRIGEYAFQLCDYLRTLNIPDSVVEIGEGAFSSSGLKVVRLPSKLKKIESKVLKTDEGVDVVAIPVTVTEIESDSGLDRVKEIYYQGTEKDWEAIKKDKDITGLDLNIRFEYYPSYEEMPKADGYPTPAPTPVPTPAPLELKLNSLILDFEAETGSFEDQSGRGIFKTKSTNEKYGGQIEFVDDTETGLTVAHLNNATVGYFMYYLQETRQNLTCEIYFKVNRGSIISSASIARLGEQFRLYEDRDSACIPNDVMNMEPAPSWICISGANGDNKVGLEQKDSIDTWVHFTYIRKGDVEFFYINGQDITNGGVNLSRDTNSNNWAYLGGTYNPTHYNTDLYFAYMRVYAGAASPEWVKKMYDNRNTPYDAKNPTVPTIEGDTIVGVKEETTKESLMEFVYENENSDIVTSEGTALASTALVGTGAKLTFDGDEYSVVVKKDVSGDGKITSIDYLKLKRHFAGNTLTGVFQKAGDANSDDRITSADYLLTKRYFAK